MTSRDQRPPAEPGRLDLSAVAPTAAETDRVVGAVMARLSRRPAAPPMSPVVETLALSRAIRWVAAAAVVLGAVSLVVSQRRPAKTPSIDVVSEWATQRYVPTNAELLLAFQGYGGFQR